MSVQAIHQYRVEFDRIVKYGGTKKETAIRNAFYNLLNEYARPRGLMMVAEISVKTPSGKIITPDGTLKDSLRLDWGYWESKDEADDLDEEIQKKFAKGYPKDNRQPPKTSREVFQADKFRIILFCKNLFSFLF